MTGLLKTAKRVGDKVAPKEIRDRDPLDQAVSKGVKSLRFAPRLPVADQAAVVPLPDEEALAKATRRRRSRRAGARAATVLTGGDNEAVG